MSEWQPIETAPKDGTWIYATDSKFRLACHWADAPDNLTGGWVIDYRALLDCFYPTVDIKLTHWMPLPDLPQPDDE